MADRLLAAFIIALSGVYLFATHRLPALEIGDPLGPKAFPYLIGLAGIVAAVWLIAENFKRGKAGGAPVQGAQHHPLAVVAVLAWMLVFYLLIERLGFLLSCAIFLAGLTAYFNRGRWLMNACVYLGFPLFVYFAFTKILSISLPRGVLPF